MSVRRLKPDYPFLAAEPGPELVEQELRNEFLVEEVQGNNRVNSVSRKRLGLEWLREYLSSLNDIIEESDVPRELSVPNVGEYVTIGELFGYPAGTPPWHAENMKFWITTLVTAFKCHETTLTLSDMDLILDAGIRLGAAIKEFEIDRKHSGPLKSGLKRRESLDRAREATNAKRQVRATESYGQWRAAATEVWSLKPGMRVTPCAKVVIKRLGIKASEKTVADQIRGLRPGKSGGAG
jgi:hypothetical protein